ncbi:MAG: AbrB/MazE/SpoVT family DNA-binding domain-containing protein [Verrucomicrobiota bacterium]
MVTKVSSKGQIVLPKALREEANISEGDELEVGLASGFVVLRKPEPLDPTTVRRLLRKAQKSSEISEEDQDAVDRAIQRVRSRAS